jgi:hypothetical protein
VGTDTICEKESFGWKMSTVSKVRTGDGLIEHSNIYTGAKRGPNQLKATALALDLSISEFLNDY